MKSVTHRGHRIAYEVHGEGPTVVLQHGLMGNRRQWVDGGYVEGLSDAFQVICVDSLGHGESDKPQDAAPYQREARSGDIAAVLDAEGIDRAHYIGYSMGGWIGSGMAIFQAQRLLSLTIGGWDPIGGPSSPNRASGLGAVNELPASTDFDAVIELAGSMAPELVAGITNDAKPGLAACWAALADVAGSKEALAALTIPSLLWAGEDDGCYEPTRKLANEADNVDFLGVPGDHVAAHMVHVKESLAGLRGFLERVSPLQSA